jgi:hypothetical protein
MWVEFVEEARRGGASIKEEGKVSRRREDT